VLRKILVLLECGVLLAALLVVGAAWQQQRALEQPLHLTEEMLLESPTAHREAETAKAHRG